MDKQLLVEGYALEKIGSSRRSQGLYYLINDKSTDEMHIRDLEKDIVYLNANGHAFYKDVWEMEQNNIGELASPQALLELRAYAWIQHKQNGHWEKTIAAEFDIKYLVGTYSLEGITILNKYIDSEELDKIGQIIDSIKI